MNIARQKFLHRCHPLKLHRHIFAPRVDFGRNVRNVQNARSLRREVFNTPEFILFGKGESKIVHFRALNKAIS